MGSRFGIALAGMLAAASIVAKAALPTGWSITELGTAARLHGATAACAS
jgi:hypothetical protein